MPINKTKLASNMFSPLKLLESKVPFAPYIKGERRDRFISENFTVAPIFIVSFAMGKRSLPFMWAPPVLPQLRRRGRIKRNSGEYGTISNAVNKSKFV
jgi:hypothetical protein